MNEGREEIGLLSPASSDAFINILMQTSPLLKMTGVNKLDSPVCQRAATLGNRFKSRSVGRTTAVELNERERVVFDYECKQIVLGQVLSDSDIEDSGDDPQAIAQSVAADLANDLQYLFLQGDTTTSTDGLTGEALDKALLATSLDGIQKQLTDGGYVHAYTGTPTTVTEKIKQLLKAMPETLKASLNTQLLVPPADYIDLWGEVDTRKSFVKEKDGLLYVGALRVTPLEHLTNIIAGRPLACRPGITRTITLEKQRYPERVGWKVVTSVRVDVDGLWRHMLMGVTP